MRKTIVIYALVLAAVILTMQLVNYYYLVRSFTIEFYLGIIALVFATMGIWVGWRLTTHKAVDAGLVAPPPLGDALTELDPGAFGISKREEEVLILMAQGLSNQEIADKLFVSLNTIKTHSANLFLKLDVKRRTQAVHRARELKIIP